MDLVPSHDDVELVEQRGVEDPKIQHIVRALEADLEAGVLQEASSENLC